MICNLAPNLTHFTKGLVKYVPCRGLFSCLPLSKRELICGIPPPIVERLGAGAVAHEGAGDGAVEGTGSRAGAGGGAAVVGAGAMGGDWIKRRFVELTDPDSDFWAGGITGSRVLYSETSSKYTEMDVSAPIN